MKKGDSEVWKPLLPAVLLLNCAWEFKEEFPYWKHLCVASEGDKSFAVNYSVELKILKKYQLNTSFGPYWLLWFLLLVNAQDIFDHMDNLSVIIFMCEKISEAFAEITDITFWNWLTIVLDFSFLTPILALLKIFISLQNIWRGRIIFKMIYWKLVKSN